MIRKIVILIIPVLMVIQVVAQRAQGSWQDYLSYTSANKIALTPDKVFCATGGGLMYYDLEDNSVNKFASVAELSDFGIKTIAYSEENNVLIVAYTNSNIDLVYGSNVFNLSDLKRKQITGDKTIYNISFIGNEAYFACGFGIVVINLEKKEVKDTYFIGDGGSSIVVNDVTADDNFLYAATNNGILKADRNGGNLQDYHNWSKIEDIPHANQKFSHVNIHAGRLVANYTPDTWFEDEMYIYNGSEWVRYLPQIGYAFDVQNNGSYLTIASREQVFVINENDEIVSHITQYQFENETMSGLSIDTRSAAISSNGTLWIADALNSLIKVNGENFEVAQVNGPADNSVFYLYQSASNLWVMPGGQVGYTLPHFQRLNSDGQWKNFTKSKNPELDEFFNIISVVVDPGDETHFFIGSWGGGLLEYKNDELVIRYTNKNSPLESALPQSPDAPYVWVDGMAFDSDRNLWITNSQSGKNLHKLSPQGEWKSFVLPEAENDYNLGKLIITENGDKWVVIRDHDVYVVNKDGSKKKYLPVTSYFNNGENEIFNRMNNILSIAEDIEGTIWLGTTKGVAVYTNPNRVWDSQNYYAIQPSLDLNDGYYHPLLETETVTAIAVDGANRKWLGTQSSGAYLVSENGDTELMHFTAENSPLLSNNITSLTINPKNGEIFFGTDKGLISYLGEAIGGKDSYANVYVYPNPVRETYDGPVTVTGLKENTEVKITDVSGNLVFRTKSLGGQAVWDGKNLNGNRVKTGVYLVLCNDEFGEETHISKLLFIH
jgi:sugar lactone lactonase YvrE